MALQSLKNEAPDVVAGFGFGSFFRSDNAADCDLLLVIGDQTRERGRLHRDLTSYLGSVGQRLGIRFDLTILTESEHQTEPLLEDGALVQLFSATD
jgi:hypothetical protein